MQTVLFSSSAPGISTGGVSLVRAGEGSKSGVRIGAKCAGASKSGRLKSGKGLGCSEKKVLLHTCCAPCACAIIERLLQEGIEPVVFYSNSNITPFEEYQHRMSECIRYCQAVGVEVVEDDYDHSDWIQCVALGNESAPERGSRCLECFKYRLLRSAQYAASQGIKLLTTALASSRWKSLEQVDAAGFWACSQVEGVEWWSMNWRKGGLQERRNQLLKEMDFYNQLFCGCEYSR